MLEARSDLAHEEAHGVGDAGVRDEAAGVEPTHDLAGAVVVLRALESGEDLVGVAGDAHGGEHLGIGDGVESLGEGGDLRGVRAVVHVTGEHGLGDDADVAHHAVLHLVEGGLAGFVDEDREEDGDVVWGGGFAD